MASTSISLIIPLADAQRSPKTGSKAANLSRLIAARFAVPRGFVISSDAYHSHLWASGARDLASNAVDTEQRVQLREALIAAPMPDDVWRPIAQAYERLGMQVGVPDPKVSVRASAVEKGFADGCFRGAYESILNVCGLDALHAAVKRVWASTWGGKAAAYRDHLGIAAEPAMAVIVQQMITAEYAGVASTANRVMGDPCRADVSCFFGPTGSAQYSIDLRDMSLAQRSEPEHRVLDDEVVKFIAEQAIRTEDIIGGKVEIDWVLAQGQLWMLQATSLVDLPVFFPAPELSRHGDNVWRRMSEEPMSHFARSLFEESPRMCLVNGYLHSRRGADDDTAGKSSIRKTLRAARTVLDEWRAGFQPRLSEAAHRVIDLNLSGLSYADLLQVFSETTRDARAAVSWVEKMQDLQTAVLPELESLTSGISGDPSLLDKLLGGIPSPAILRDAKLQEFGDRFRIAEDTHKLDDEGWRHAYKREVDAFAREYGYSHTDQSQIYDVMSWVSWIENSDPVFHIIGTLKRQGSRPSLVTRHCAAEQAASAAAAEVMQALKSAVRGRFSGLLQISRDLIAAYDQAQMTCALVQTALRLIMNDMGRRLREMRLIHRAEDIRHLTLDELATIADEPSPAERKKTAALVAQRKHQVWLELRLQAPRTLRVTDGEVLAENADEPVSALRGRFAGYSSVTGHARVLRTLVDADELTPGDIMVVSEPGLAWTPLLAIAGGLISETAAECPSGPAVARDYGVPTVIGCVGATKAISDGLKVRINASDGNVIIENSVSRPVSQIEQ